MPTQTRGPAAALHGSAACADTATVSAEGGEVVRRIYAAWKRRESARSYIADEVEYVNPSYAVEPGTRRGPKSFAAVRDTYEDFDPRPVRFIDAGEDRVVVLAYYQGTGRARACR